eukprot:NODE_1370_length_1450_cov_3.805139_g1138_i0.p9 GENE.NODE_1370_length_1450_cov_3.805139_g1138_i0~~NODE_1370_length_1450_cov_3.805139_g1138_i0.p9  ORF type:complete len:55 (+),score=2.91 NODE_1370_length_1450_cov_3.805139_g1138_i0:803-967(+)
MSMAVPCRFFAILAKNRWGMAIKMAIPHRLLATSGQKPVGNGRLDGRSLPDFSP